MVARNISKIRERIAAICSRINREPSSINIVCVSKGRPQEQIREAIEAGITDIGENKVQEALTKYNQFQALGSRLPTIRWHMIGHLQTNKCKDAVRIFDLIHSVDSIGLAQKIDREALKLNKVQDCLIEVKTSPEATKFGIKPEDAIAAIEEIGKLKNINIKGLMTIAPLVDNPEKSRSYFRLLRELRDRINSLQLTAYSLQLLSMGMTDDFEVAIEEGSTMIRLGRAIFEG